MSNGLTRIRSFGWRIACVTLLTYVLVLQSLFVPFQRAQAQGFSGIDAELKVLCLTGAEKGDAGQDKDHCGDMPCCLPAARHVLLIAVTVSPVELPAFELTQIAGEAWQSRRELPHLFSKYITLAQPRAPPLRAA